MGSIMMTCTMCGYRFLVVAHMCDEDLDPDGLYCNLCFEDLGCEREHAPGCATHVYASQKPSLAQLVRRCVASVLASVLPVKFALRLLPNNLLVCPTCGITREVFLGPHGPCITDNCPWN